MSEVDEAWAAVRGTLRLRYEWERAQARGQMRVATPPDPMKDIRFLVSAIKREEETFARAVRVGHPLHISGACVVCDYLRSHYPELTRSASDEVRHDR